MIRRLCLAPSSRNVCCLQTGAVSSPAPSADLRVTQLADAYLAAYFDRNPDQVTVYGVPGRPHERLPDNSLEALAAWRAKEDSWLTEAHAITPSSVTAPSLRATHAILADALEGSIGARVCRSELWNVSQMTGWQVQFGYLVTIQPVNSESARHDALARWGALAKYLDVEIANLREGLRQGFSAPKLNVRIVMAPARFAHRRAGRSGRWVTVPVARRARLVARVQERVHPSSRPASCCRPSRNTGSFSNESIFRPRERRSASVRIPRVSSATTRRSVYSAHCRCRPRRFTSLGCGRWTRSWPRCGRSPAGRFKRPTCRQCSRSCAPIAATCSRAGRS